MWKMVNAISREHLTQPGVMNKEGIAEQEPPEVAHKERVDLERNKCNHETPFANQEACGKTLGSGVKGL